MRARSSAWETALATALCAAGLLLHYSPDIRPVLRAAVRDALRPGQLAVQRVQQWAAALPRTREAERAARIERLTRDVARWKERCRQVQIANMRLKQQVTGTEQNHGLWSGSSAGAPLIVPDLVPAAVLGEEISTLLRAGKLIDFGSSRALTESTLVLEDTRPLIDQGQAAQLDGGQAVYSGRAVVGRIANVGQWVSTLQHITDPDYRGFARIGRPADNGIVFGPRGILAGCGERLCRLSEISSTESVAVGDEVYTADETFPEPMYYGRVVHAELEPGGLRWGVRVEPAVPLDKVRKVQVLRQRVNPERMLAN